MPSSRTRNDLSPLLLFVRAPVKGRVKSRLAASLGDEQVLALYQAFVLDLLDTIEERDHATIICYDPPEERNIIARWLGAGRHYRPQQGNDLGERMEHAFRTAFSSGAVRATLIGSDFPDLPTNVISEAFDELERHDAVIGPALDGGYYLIGFSKNGFRPEIFRDMHWSAPDVFGKTMAVFGRTGSQVHVLPQWQDVDTIEDLRALYQRNKGTAFEQSRTMKAIRTTFVSSLPPW